MKWVSLPGRRRRITSSTGTGCVYVYLLFKSKLLLSYSSVVDVFNVRLFDHVCACFRTKNPLLGLVPYSLAVFNVISLVSFIFGLGTNVVLDVQRVPRRVRLNLSQAVSFLRLVIVY